MFNFTTHQRNANQARRLLNLPVYRAGRDGVVRRKAGRQYGGALSGENLFFNFFGRAARHGGS